MIKVLCVSIKNNINIININILINIITIFLKFIITIIISICFKKLSYLVSFSLNKYKCIVLNTKKQIKNLYKLHGIGSIRKRIKITQNIKAIYLIKGVWA